MLQLILLGGLLGLLGQGARAVVGLKGMVDNAKALDVSSADLFRAARLLTSLLIGFLVGMAAAFPYLSFGAQDHLTLQQLLTIVAAGYAGTDFLEAFISQYLSPSGNMVSSAIAVRSIQLANKNVNSSFLIPSLPATAPKLTQPQIQAEIVSLTKTDLGDQSLNVTASTDFRKDLHYTDEALIAFVEARVLGRWPTIQCTPAEVVACQKVSDLAKLVFSKLK